TWFPTFIAINVMQGHIISQIIFWVGLISNTIFVVNLIKFTKLAKKLKREPKLQEALEDELHIFNIGKSYKFSYWTIIGSTTILIVITSFASLSALVTAELILYVGVLSFFCSSLYYNRD
ncbi:MAG TPA: hypothetical protein VK205_00500, partial [Prolixibacteraceae bacterium]|nr:hypothetical protein [Prolixibacteraceae bacterium]